MRPAPSQQVSKTGGRCFMPMFSGRWRLARGKSWFAARRGIARLFLLPALLFTIVMVIFPTFFGIYIAFTDWNLSAFDPPKLNGLDNLRTLVNDAYFWNALLNMVYYILGVLVQYTIAFGLALAAECGHPGAEIFPRRLSAALHAEPRGGELDDRQVADGIPLRADLLHLMRHIGWDSPAFFTTPWIARLSIIALDAWVWIPFIMILLLAGLQALPKEVQEAAKVDGATPWQSFWQITFPLMLPVSVTAIILRIIFQLKLADIVINTTSGGPGGATDTVSSFVYREYRERSNVGYGTMIAEVYLIIIIIFISLLLRFVSRWMQREEST